MASRTVTIVLSGMMGALAGALLACMVYSVLESRRDNGIAITTRGILAVAAWTTIYAWDKGHLPEGEFLDLIDALRNTEQATRLPRGMAAQGLDSWGNPIRYLRLTETHGVIRSHGPNGRDDDGAGDDIQVVVSSDGYRVWREAISGAEDLLRSAGGTDQRDW